MRFADPAYLLLLLVPAACLWRGWPRRSRPPEVHLTVPALPPAAAGGGRRARWGALPLILRTAALCLVVVALARPQVQGGSDGATTRGRNIVLALDISSSMKARDFGPDDRLAVAKEVLARFAARREGDLIGLVVFARQALTRVPLVVDTGLLLEILRRVEIGLLPDGTAIGTALATSLDLVKDLPPESSAVVLLTDGGNNAGRPGPLVAAEAARALGVRVYTIGVTAAGGPVAAEVDRNRPPGDEPPSISSADEAVLRRIAERTGGRYHRAADHDTLERVLAEIDRIERTEVRIRRVRQYEERYAVALAPALALLAAELLLRATWLRTLP